MLLPCRRITTRYKHMDIVTQNYFLVIVEFVSCLSDNLYVVVSFCCCCFCCFWCCCFLLLSLLTTMLLLVVLPVVVLFFLLLLILLFLFCCFEFDIVAFTGQNDKILLIFMLSLYEMLLIIGKLSKTYSPSLTIVNQINCCWDIRYS